MLISVFDGFLGLLWVGVWVSVGVTIAYWRKLQTVAIAAPRVERTKIHPDATVAVIIPAYNEAANLEACVRAVLDSTAWSAAQMTVWVVDDQSTDETLAIAHRLQADLADPRLTILAGQARPDGEQWMGKNWACEQAVQQATGEFLLFVDADVRLQADGIPSAIAAMQAAQSDLLTCCPTIVCQNWAEWLAQPIIFGLIVAGLPFHAVNDPQSDAVFAVGPFMLFRRTAYDHIGGHRGVADQVVEDVELARRIKQSGLKLQYAIGHAIAAVHMYPSAPALWEGWTKNWHLGCHRNLLLSLYTIGMVFLVCVLPVVSLGVGLMQTLNQGWHWGAAGLIALSLVTLGMQWSLRGAIASLTTIPPRYWWLTSVGGLFVIAIILASVIKTETGWGWTWRGRPLQQPGKPRNLPDYQVPT